MRHIKILFMIFYVKIVFVYSANILGVFPTPSLSHQIVFRKLTLELAKKGHNMTIITTDPVYPKGQAPDNYKEIDVGRISYPIFKKNIHDTFKVGERIPKFTEGRYRSFLFLEILETQIKTQEVQELLTKDANSFDLILIEAFMYLALAFSHKFKAPVILISSLGPVYNNNDIMGTPSHPFLYPAATDERIYNLSFLEKINNLYTLFSYKYASYLNEDYENVQLQKYFGQDLPPISELYNNVGMLFLNVHPMWVDNQPVPPNVIYMGSVHQVAPKDLPEDLKRYLDSSEKGVIYVSFGTNVLPRMLPEDKIKMMASVLSNLPYNVLWKWTQDLPGLGSNVNISKWYPQADLLRHPNVKLFITQAGLQSTDEAITAVVPLLAIPILGDQRFNAEKYEKHGIGMKLEIETVTENELKNAIESLINNESYKKNIKNLKQLYLDEPEPPLQRAVWWTEYVIRNKGAKHLRCPAANMSNAEYFEFKFIAIILFTLVLSCFVLMKILTFVIKLLLNVFRRNKLKIM